MQAVRMIENRSTLLLYLRWGGWGTIEEHEILVGTLSIRPEEEADEMDESEESDEDIEAEESEVEEKI